MFGILSLPWWGYLLVYLVLTQLTTLAVTLYLHRGQTHRAVDYHPAISHFFRFWVWLTTGMITKQWVAIHRKHHAYVETAQDPHSPQVKGIWKVLFEGAELYKEASLNEQDMEHYGQGTPDDWIERHLYSKYSSLGISLMMGIHLLLFGAIGLLIWPLQMAWIPFCAAGLVNGVGHYIGYRNFEPADASRNLTPLAIFLGGEELHNNHHAYASSAKFSARWFEVDLGWGLIRLLEFFHLCQPKRILPTPKMLPTKNAIDKDTVKALILYRFQVLAEYTREVILPALEEERKRAGKTGAGLLRRAKTLLIRDSSLIKASQKTCLTTVLANFQSLQIVYQFRLRLQEIWMRSTATQKELIEALQEWCKQAESTGIETLWRFARQLKTYVPQEAR